MKQNIGDTARNISSRGEKRARAIICWRKWVKTGQAVQRRTNSKWQKEDRVVSWLLYSSLGREVLSELGQCQWVGSMLLEGYVGLVEERSQGETRKVYIFRIQFVCLLPCDKVES